MSIILSKFFKKYWKQILVAVIIALLSGGITFLFKQLEKANDEKTRLNEVVFKKTVQYDDAEGRHVTESTEQRLKISELEEMVANGDSTKSVLLRELKLNNQKLKNVESMSMSTITVHDTLYNQFYMTDTNAYDTIHEFKNQYMKCTQISDGMMVCDYQDTLIWNVSKYHKDKFKFKNLFVKRDWYYKLTAKYLNPNAKINFQEYIRVENKKNKRKTQD